MFVLIEKAEYIDIDLESIKLGEFRRNMEENRDVLEGIKEDELADFDPEDFKRIEKLVRELLGTP